MKKELKKPGPKINMERHKQLGGWHGHSQRNIKRMQEGLPRDRGPVVYTHLRSWDTMGTIRGGYENHFKSPEESIAWWLKNADRYCTEQHAAYLQDLAVTSGHGHPGRRSNYFFEMCFAVKFPSHEDEVLLIESHSLWYPGERQHIIKQGVTIPVINPCPRHAHGWPIEFGSSAMLKMIDGKITMLGFDDCASVMTIWKRERSKKGGRS